MHDKKFKSIFIFKNKPGECIGAQEKTAEVIQLKVYQTKIQKQMLHYAKILTK